MGSILSAIDDDMDDYVALCERFGEQPQRAPDAYVNLLLDCYGAHAKELRKRSDELRYRQETRAMPRPVPTQTKPAIPNFKHAR
jgi:hypothetical protein